jgi:hypothetical protein
MHAAAAHWFPVPLQELTIIEQKSMIEFMLQQQANAKRAELEAR